MEKTTSTNLIKLGKIGATFGVKGWLKIHTYTEYGASILDYSPWYLLDKSGNLIETITIENSHLHSSVILAKLPGFDTPETARKLTGLEIAINREQLPKLGKDEFYWSDLEGMKVYDMKNQLLGTVIYLISTGSNDVLVVKKDDKEHAIPFRMDSVIKKVDMDKHEIHVDWELL